MAVGCKTELDDCLCDYCMGLVCLNCGTTDWCCECERCSYCDVNQQKCARCKF